MEFLSGLRGADGVAQMAGERGTAGSHGRRAEEMEEGVSALVNEVVFDGYLIESPQNETETWH